MTLTFLNIITWLEQRELSCLFKKCFFLATRVAGPKEALLD